MALLIPAPRAGNAAVAKPGSTWLFHLGVLGLSCGLAHIATMPTQLRDFAVVSTP